MSFITVAPARAGLFRNGTIYQSAGRWYDANLVRFQQDQIKPIGGWLIRSASAAPFAGACRAVLSWRDNSNNRWIAVGSHTKLYIQSETGVNSDITPIRRNVTLATTNPITTVSGQPTLTIHDAAHGAAVGNTVTISGATAFNGLTTGELDAVFTIVTVVDANNYTVTASGNATGSGAGGGASVKAAYEMLAGRPDAAQNLAYGGGAYGVGFYGTPRANTSAYLPASVWTLDTWGEDFVGCIDTDGLLYQWSLNTGAPAVVITNAPTGNVGLLVTAEGFLFALGAGGDGRKVAWSDQQNNTVWSPDATNQAGDFDLTTVGTLQCGRALPTGALLLTDVDAWVAGYLGAPLVYGFQRAGSGCGIISRGAIAAQDARAAWMGRGGFWLFDGQAVQPLDCDVADYVFSDMNANQVSKVSAVHLADEGEVWWFYPSGGSNENDRYVCWAYRESIRLAYNVWTIGTLSRLSGSGRGVFPTPLMVDANGLLYQHETGLNYDGAEPYIETGPFEIGKGDYMAEVQQIIPDQLADGQTSASFFGRIYPNSPEITYGPYTLVSPTDVLLQAREIRTRFTGIGMSSWRVGNMRLDVVRGDPM